MEKNKGDTKLFDTIKAYAPDTKTSLVAVAFVVALMVLGYALPAMNDVEYSVQDAHATSAVQATTSEPIPEKNPEAIQHVPLPEAVKAIYMSACVAGTPSFRDSLVALIDETELNSVVIDIKDYSGTISFNPTSEILEGAWAEAGCGARDMKEFIAKLHEKDIFVIGRITVFQDPYYTKQRPDLAVKKLDGSVWKDFKGLSFIDVGAEEYWDYIIALSKDSYNIGFDELNFDYIRFPSDGNMKDIAFTHTGNNSKPEQLEKFFAYLNEKLSDPETFKDALHENIGREVAIPYLSADLFGMTTSNHDDLSIGQVQERAAPYFDFIAPMVYPSHYPKTFLDLGDPNKYPYKVIHYAMGEGVKRMVSSTTPIAGLKHERIGTSSPALYMKPVYDKNKLRPWLQDFDYGGNYDIAEVKAQIQATYDVGLNSWMLWSPSNRYTRGALLP